MKEPPDGDYSFVTVPWILERFAEQNRAVPSHPASLKIMLQFPFETEGGGRLHVSRHLVLEPEEVLELLRRRAARHN